MSSSPNLIELYRGRIESGEINPDPAQRLIVEKLNLLVHRVQTETSRKTNFARAFFGWGREKVEEAPAQGLYIYGTVGRGKSMLMDMFAGHLSGIAWRVHFHDFMQFVHKSLDTARDKKSSDPVSFVADHIADKYRILCLDEMQIENIADAMIVGRLFERMFEKNMILVTTSNRHPSDLYKSGLNRHRFVPFVDEIEKACEIICLDGNLDYRQHEQAQTRYIYPLNDETRDRFMQIWDTQIGDVEAVEIDLGSRNWRIEKTRGEAAFVSFDDVCKKARGAKDYAALAKRFDTVFIDEVPKLGRENSSSAARFVTLIDVFYEEGTVLYLRLETSPKELHDDADTRFVWDRTLSRLSEMAKEEWPLNR